MTPNLKHPSVPLFFIILLILSTVEVSAEGYKPFIQQASSPSMNNLNIIGTTNTDLLTGAATYNYPIIVQPGINGLQPEIFLYYNHQNTNSLPSTLGQGWNFNDNYIARDTQYTLADTSDDKYILHFNGITSKLVYVASENQYHTEIESFLYIKKITGGSNDKGEYWELKTKDGTTYRFGYNRDSELVSNLQNFVSRWSLDQTTDVHGNQIIYTYSEMLDTDVYLTTIVYGNNQINLIYPISPQYTRRVYTEGRRINQYRILSEIQVYAGSALVRKFTLNYDVFNNHYFLSSIAEIGNDGSSQLPPTTFDYYEPEIGFERQDQWIIPTAFGDDEDKGVRFVDKNSDGFVDLIRGRTSGSLYYWYNTGNGWGTENFVSSFLNTGFVDSDGYDLGVRFADLNGDKQMDVIQSVTGDEYEQRIKLQSETGDWVDSSTSTLPTQIQFIDYEEDVPDLDCPSGYAPEEFYCNEYDGECVLECVKYNCYDNYNGDLIGSCTGSRSCCPSGTTPARREDKEYYDYEDFAISRDQGIRVADVNGDGFTDFLKSKGSSSWVYLTKMGLIFTASSTFTPPTEFVNENGVDRGVQLLDVNGDGLDDVVKSNERERTTWLNTGGGWELSSQWSVPAAFIDENEKQGVTFAEIDGDGLIDVVSISETSAQVWLNNGNGWTYSSAWSNFIRGLPSLTLKDYSLNLIDINGDNSADIIKAPSDTSKSTWINKAQKSYLLKEIKNSNGGKTTFQYEKSTSADNNQLMFNVWVVSSIFENNGLIGVHEQNSQAQYDYFNGNYNSVSKEFRGFANVDETLPNGAKVKHYYRQDDAQKGREYLTEIYDGIKLLKKMVRPHIHLFPIL